MSHVHRGYRFATIPEWVLYHPTLTATAIRVYGCLDRHGQTPDSCFPSYERIARFCGISERSVPRPIAELVAVGAILVVRRSVTEDETGKPLVVLGDGGRQTSNGYALAGDKPITTTHESDPAHVPERGSGYASERGPGYAQERTEREEEEREPEERENTLALDLPASSQNGSPPAEEEDPEFVEFYECAYPKKSGRKVARTAWDKAVREGARPATIIAGAWQYRSEVSERSKGYIKAPAVWLNQGCWDDEPGANDRSDRPKVRPLPKHTGNQGDLVEA